MKTLAAIALATALLSSPHVGQAQAGGAFAGGEQRPITKVPFLDKIGVDENLEGQVPADATFTRYDGKKVKLGDYFDGEHPVLLNLAYFTCPVLCSLIMDAAAKGLKGIDWTAGKEFKLVTISIDPRDTVSDAAKKRQKELKLYGRSKGWDFLVGDQKNIDKVTKAVGFRYFYMKDKGQYAHPAVLTFLTPKGKIARYLYGLNYKGSDMRLALLEASNGESVSTVDKVILYCCQYDPKDHGYSIVGYRVMQVGGALTALVLGLFLIVLWRREVRRKKKDASPSTEVSEVHG